MPTSKILLRLIDTGQLEKTSDLFNSYLFHELTSKYILAFLQLGLSLIVNVRYIILYLSNDILASIDSPVLKYLDLFS